MANFDTIMNSTLMQKAFALDSLYSRVLGLIIPVIELGLKLWVANAFFKSGLTKIQSFETTIMLFEYEYSVPLLSPTLAAYMGTAAELMLPVLLVIGLMGRYAAMALFLFNIVAATSYPDISPLGLSQHYLWGMALLMAALYGPGKLSLDHFICTRCSGANR
ncbi:INTEGRAL MEMBRANE PROTEIN (Rhomboid family) [hydrothermal vent metagenome]|uniref:INTEGRAL MEMBRANE PROTEIN (Rhomboid family) n=1 Tax=hydrothermal vent metagenome TaxID=652676 RepID=A0A3B1BGG9_9ZZZZ